jgi:N6-L-threonylcarbamoyladenine synthase
MKLLGIDTSNYTTSCAWYDTETGIVLQKKKLLPVPEGQAGLRQSDAVFHHTRQLPELIAGLAAEKGGGLHPDAVGVSVAPRPEEGSYMPCFLAGINAAREMTAVLGIPLHEFSHQEGHAAAIIENSSDTDIRRTVLFHLSGGTTEFLICEPDEDGYRMEICGGTKDISAGQLIDRAGVAMGYPFPSGAYLDDLAETYHAANGRVKPVLPRIKTADGQFNLSGTETKILRTIESSDTEDYP